MTVKPVEIKAWMGDGTEYVVRYYKEADYDLLAASNAALRELLREWIIGWGGFNSDDIKPGGLVIRTRAALKQNRRHEIAL